MKNLENVKRATELSMAGLKRCSWDDIYDSVDEMINDLKRVDCTAAKKPRGYEVISGLQKYANSGKELTEKQITTLKKLASSIAYALYNGGCYMVR